MWNTVFLFHAKHSPRSTAVMWNLLQVQSCLHVGCQWTHVDRVGQHSMFCAIFLDEALLVRDSKPVAQRSSGIHSHAQVRPADN